MLRAVYDFQAPYENTLTFKENDLFIVLKRNNKDQDWVHVINLKGVNGYAPANYLTVAECTASEEIDQIDRVLNQISNKKQNSGDQQIVIDNLNELRCKLENELETLAAKQAYELASIVRQNTKCSFLDAQTASQELLRYLQKEILEKPTPKRVERLINFNPANIPIEVRRQCEDSQELERLSRIVMEVASDQETEVSEETWNELLVLVTQADPALCIEALERHDCALIFQLVHRLQAETSWRKRRPILTILFQSLLLLPKFPQVVMNSVLVSELARDIQARSPLQDVNRERFYWSVRVLTLVLCCPERLSLDQQNSLGRDLIDFVIQVLETESVSIATTDERDDKDLAVVGMHLLLALFRQFEACSPDDNPVLHSLAARSMCDSLVEKIILLYNREGDPLEEFLFGEDSQTNSVSSFVLGLFSREETARLFYTADLQVLLDVIQRRLTDYGPGDQRRSNALQLYYAIRRVSNVLYKKFEFSKCMKEICEEENRLGTSSTTMEHDRHLVLKIYHEFPELLSHV